MRKDSPSVTSVHVSSALGGSEQPKRRRDFLSIIGELKPKVIYPEDTDEVSDEASGGVTTDVSITKIYNSVKELPKAVRDRIKGKKRRRQWMHVFNSTLQAHGDEGRAFAGAWSTVQKKSKKGRRDEIGESNPHMPQNLDETVNHMGIKATVGPHGDLGVSKTVAENGPGSQVLSAGPMVGVGGRTIEPFDDDTLHIPFLYDPIALAYLRSDQVPRVLDAITHPDRLPLAIIRLDNLVAVKSRVGRDTVQKNLDKINDGAEINPPVVCIINGMAYILDGHDRLAAMWLNGDDECDVHCDDVDPYDNRKPDPTTDHEGSLYDLLAGADGRRLIDYQSGTLAIPFLYDQGFFSHLRPDQVPKFLSAITHPDDLDDATVPMDSLVAIQDRVNADTVASRVEKPSKKRPVIVRMNGRNYIGDGHDRLTAAWLAGANDAAVKLVDITQADNRMKPDVMYKRQVNVEVKKVDKDRQQIFGWLSVVTKDGTPVIDLQDEIIDPEELEKAVYDYMLNSREGGDMHDQMGIGKCIESVMLTDEKKKSMGIESPYEGWWGGFLITDRSVWSKIRSGNQLSFSIGGLAASKEL